MGFFYYYDWSYLVLVVPALLFSLWASARVNSTFKRSAPCAICTV